MSLSGRSLPALALLTDISNKEFNLCDPEELPVWLPLKAGLEQPNPFHWGNSVWTHRRAEANTQACPCKHHTSFLAHTCKKVGWFWTLCVQRDLSFQSSWVKANNTTWYLQVVSFGFLYLGNTECIFRDPSNVQTGTWHHFILLPSSSVLQAWKIKNLRL